MILIPITPDNLSLATEVAREIFPYEVHADGFWPAKAYAESIAVNRPRFKYYLVADGFSDVVGITGHYPPDDDKPELWLSWFGVRPSYRRGGYGARILHATHEIVARLGCYEFRLYSGDRDEERAVHRLYARLGYKMTGRGEVDGAPVLYFKIDLPL